MFALIADSDYLLGMQNCKINRCFWLLNAPCDVAVSGEISRGNEINLFPVVK